MATTPNFEDCRNPSSLLGRLAGLGWFTQHGEIAVTQPVPILLEEPPSKFLCCGVSGRPSRPIWRRWRHFKPSWSPTTWLAWTSRVGTGRLSARGRRLAQRTGP